AAPVVLADARRERRFAGRRAHAEAEPESIAGAGQVQLALGYRRSEMVGGHEGERGRAQQPLAVEFAAIQKRLRDTRVVRRGSAEAAPARFEPALDARIVERDSGADRAVVGKRFGDP